MGQMICLHGFDPTMCIEGVALQLHICRICDIPGVPLLRKGVLGLEWWVWKSGSIDTPLYYMYGLGGQWCFFFFFQSHGLCLGSMTVWPWQLHETSHARNSLDWNSLGHGI